ncbi:MAG TPA: hypothetical protein VJ020_11790, partial [Anaerolineales bacterium]|nr:hypothetical protein [Anaerolineales bacterium]
DTYVGLMIDRVPIMRLQDMIEEATPFISQLMSSLYAQIDPLYLGGSFRSLDIAVQYGNRLMQRYAYSDWSEDKIKKLVDHLAWDYPSHSFVIDYSEAEEIGLKVKPLNGESGKNADAITEKMNVWIGFSGETEQQEA